MAIAAADVSETTEEGRALRAVAVLRDVLGELRRAQIALRRAQTAYIAHARATARGRGQDVTERTLGQFAGVSCVAVHKQVERYGNGPVDPNGISEAREVLADQAAVLEQFRGPVPEP